MDTIAIEDIYVTKTVHNKKEVLVAVVWKNDPLISMSDGIQNFQIRFFFVELNAAK